MWSLSDQKFITDFMFLFPVSLTSTIYGIIQLLANSWDTFYPIQSFCHLTITTFFFLITLLLMFCACFNLLFPSPLISLTESSLRLFILFSIFSLYSFPCFSTTVFSLTQHIPVPIKNFLSYPSLSLSSRVMIHMLSYSSILSSSSCVTLQTHQHGLRNIS